ncbi:MAG: hypothetical protein IJR47_00910 [Clostridia bacterium]|nr:hypothetical protein [Clostridia bacterium]
MRYKKVLAFIFGVVLLVFCGFSFKRTERQWNKWLKGNEQEYYGNLNLWHIKDDYSVNLPYEKLLKRFEKQNFGIFINVESLTSDEAGNKIENGEYPDLIIYSRSLFPVESYAELNSLKIPLEQSGKHKNKLFAYALCYDTYIILLNDEIIDETEEDLGVVTPEHLVNSLIKLPFKEGVLPMGFTSLGGALNLADAMGEQTGDIPYASCSVDDFAAGKTAVLVCGKRELEEYKGELPSNTEYIFSEFTDRGRFLSVYNSGDESRVKYAKMAAEMLLSESSADIIDEFAFSAAKAKDVRLLGAFNERIDEAALKALINADRKKLLERIGKMK